VLNRCGIYGPAGRCGFRWKIKRWYQALCIFVMLMLRNFIFRRGRKIAKRDCYICLFCLFRPYVCPSVRTEQLGSYRTDFYKIRYLWIFRNSFQKIQVSLKSDNNNGTLHEDLCTFMIISRWILVRMRNVSDKICRENQNTHFMLNNFFPKIAPFMRKCGKMWQSQTGHRWQHNTAHALCMLDN
jgi:hypothetical protein